MKLDEIKELVRIFGKSKINTMKIKIKDFELEMEKGGVVPVSAPATIPAPAPVTEVVAEVPAEPAKAADQEIKGDLITSPMVGTFYASPSPDSPPFIKVGDKVKKGQPLCILEAMKIMNEVEAEFDCIITDILVQDGEAVEYDKPLFVIEKL